LEININIFEFESIEVEVTHKNADKCSEKFIEAINNSISKVIKELEKEENGIKQDIKEYDQAFSDSPLLHLSSVLMFKQITCNINL